MEVTVTTPDNWIYLAAGSRSLTQGHRYMRTRCVTFFQPTFLYESVLDLVIFCVLILLQKTKKIKTGNLTAIYFILYSIVRILVESIRIDCTTFVFGIPAPIVVSAIIIIVSCFYLFKNSKISE